MTLQQLHYFAMTAELRSFTKAAEKCHVSQPALSHAIRELENELNCRLFLRVGRQIQITEAGMNCLERVKSIERSIQEMYQVAADRGNVNEISIGYVVLGHLNSYFSYQATCIPREFLKKYQVVTMYDEIAEICRHLTERRYDFIIVPAWSIKGLPPHEKVQITPDGLSLIVGKQNPLFSRKEVEVHELAEMPFIFFPNNDPLNAAYIELCKQNGFEPNVVGYGKKMGDIINEVWQKNAVAFCSSTFEYLESSETHIIRLKGKLQGFHLELVKLRSNANPAAMAFFKIFQKHPVR